MSTDPVWSPKKKGVYCTECPFREEICLLKGSRPTGEHPYNLVFAFEKPEREAMWSNIAVDGRTAQLMLKMLEVVEARLRRPLKVSVVYAVGHATDKAPPAAALHACSGYMLDKLVDLHGRMGYLGAKRPPNVVVAFGTGVQHQLGVTETKLEKARGRLFETNIRNTPWVVVPTFSMRHIHAKPGLLTHLQADIAIAVAALFEDFAPLPISEISKNYVYPTTGKELLEFTSDVLAYTGNPKIKPESWPLAADYETNTLHMHLDIAKPIAFSTSWAPGYSAAWLLDHREADPEERAGVWAGTLRLLTAGRRLIWHNRMFDQTVDRRMATILERDVPFRLRVAELLGGDAGRELAADPWSAFRRVCASTWMDTQFAEHHLEENAQGSYSLKTVILKYRPDFGGYESQLRRELLRVQKTFEDRYDEVVEYETFESLHAGVARWDILRDLPKACRDLLDLEDRYMRVSFLVHIHPKNSPERAQFTKEKTSLRGKISNRYKQLGVERPEAAKVDMATNVEEFGSFEDLPVEVLLPYAAVDTDATRQVCEGQHVEMRAQSRRRGEYEVLADNYNVMSKIYVPGLRTLSNAAYRGIRIDTELLEQYDATAQEWAQECLQKMWDLACTNFRPTVAKDIEHVFTAVLGVPHDLIERTKTDLMATSAEALEAISRRFPGEPPAYMAYLLQTYKLATMASSNYLKGIRNNTHIDGRLHASFGMHTTVTGRLSVSRPSLQNYPKFLARSSFWAPSDVLLLHGSIELNAQGEEVLVYSMGQEKWRFDGQALAAIKSGRRTKLGGFDGLSIKKILIPSEGMVWFNADVSSAEIRMMCAFLGEGASLVQAVRDGMNVPSYITAKVFADRIITAFAPGIAQLPESEREHAVYLFVEQEKDNIPDLELWRTGCKRVLYGVAYGAGDVQLALQIFGWLAAEGTKRFEEQVAFARDIKAAIFREFSDIPLWIARTERLVEIDKRVRSIFGRYRRFPLMDYSRSNAGAAKREGVNFSLQSPASDCVVIASASMEADLHALGGHELLLVHDAISGEIPTGNVHHLPGLFDHHMVKVVARECPQLPVDWAYELGVGPNYKDLIPYAEVESQNFRGDNAKLAAKAGLLRA